MTPDDLGRLAGLRWALCLAAAAHALGLRCGGALDDFGQRRLVLFLAKHLEES